MMHVKFGHKQQGVLIKSLTAFLGVITLCVSAWGLTPQQEAQLQVKALFLFNFSNYVEWPEAAFKNEAAPIHLCLYGAAEFAPFMFALEDTLIGDRRLAITHTSNIDLIKSGCHVLFVGEDRQAELPQLFTQIQYLYVLSMGEDVQFNQRGGIVYIHRNADKVQFDIDISRALDNGLLISSDLLMLARKIKRYARP